MSEFTGTPGHFRLHRQVAEALDALNRRNVWLRLSVVGGQPESDQGIDKIVRDVDAFLNTIQDFDFDAVGVEDYPAHTALGNAAQANVQAFKRGADFQASDLPLVVNPTPWVGYYS